MSGYANELDCALRAARVAGEIAREQHGRIAFDAKSDESPVTAADRACEAAIVQILEKAFPEDGFLGEEGADKPSPSGRRWIIDPIDGTRDFIRGNPTWANLIALEDEGEVVVAVANLAALGETYSAVLGGGAWIDSERIHASRVTKPADAVLSLDSLTNINRYPFAAGLFDFMEQFWAVRAMGGCFDALMVARGRFDLWIETSGKPWDFAALKLIAQEAGARYFDFTGQNTIYGNNAIIAAPGMEPAVRQFLGLR